MYSNPPMPVMTPGRGRSRVPEVESWACRAGGKRPLGQICISPWQVRTAQEPYWTLGSCPKAVLELGIMPRVRNEAQMCLGTNLDPRQGVVPPSSSGSQDVAST